MTGMQAAAPQAIAVIGAGIVGVAAALHLQRDGHAVTLIDPREPGTGTSFGNAGVLSAVSCIPVGTPGVLRSLPRLLLDPTGPLSIRWSYLPRMMPWLWHFLRASTPARVESISIALAELVRRLHAPWKDLLADCDAEDLVRWVGWLKVAYTERALEGGRADTRVLARRGLAFEILGQDELRQLEPALSRELVGGVFLPDCGFCLQPDAVVQRFALSFARRGGTVLRATATGFRLDGDRPVAVRHDGGEVAADAIVIAAGAWSRPLAAELGAKVPLDTERGYHAMLPTPAAGVGRPLLDLDHGFMLAPMRHGLRVTTGVELAGLDAPADFRRLRRTVALARKLLPGLAGEPSSEWLGFRPSLPDSLPVIGRSPRHANVVLAFGHGHIGLTLGPLTGRIVADLVAGRTPPLDLSPYDAGRWAGRAA